MSNEHLLAAAIEAQKAKKRGLPIYEAQRAALRALAASVREKGLGLHALRAIRDIFDAQEQTATALDAIAEDQDHG